MADKGKKACKRKGKKLDPSVDSIPGREFFT